MTDSQATPALSDGLGAFIPDGVFQVSGSATGPLAGLTFAAKDIFDVEGLVTGCGNPQWAASHGPAQHNAVTVQKLLDAGATLMGKTITDELAFSLNGQNFHYGTPTNANAPGRIPGGSSSGSAAAVAGGLVDIALGTDTGGSVRIPASYCGIFGIRTSHDRVSRAGVMPLADSFDTVGWFARDAELMRRVGEVLLEEAPPQDFEPKGLLIAADAFALLEEDMRARLLPIVAQLESRLGKAESVDIAAPGGGFESLMLAFRSLQAREIWAEHGAWISAAQPTFGPEIAERFDWVQSITPEAAAAAHAKREAFTRATVDLLNNGAILCLPTARGIAPLCEASPESLRQHRGDTLGLTSIANLTGLPQISLPVATHQGCPLGLSLMAAKGQDAALLAFAESFLSGIERASGQGEK
ncbi:MAG: amidase [Pseudomonadota bacterium]